MNDSLKPEETVLVVIDMLEDFFDPGLWPESDLPGRRGDLVEAIGKCVRIFRKAGCPVFWVQQAFEPDLSDAFPHMRRTGRRYTIRDTAGARVLHELDQQCTDPVVMKKRFSAFYGTDLRQQLEASRKATVCLAGITTSWCVRSTATDAYQADFRVVLCDGCMAGFRDADHERDLAAMSGYIAELRGLASLAEEVR